MQKVILFAFFTVIRAQTPETPTGDAVTSFQPSLAVVASALVVMIFLTFILLLFVKCCRTQSPIQNLQNQGRLTRSRSRYSGLDKTVIESLPFFRFSALKGSREGLECAVCLSKFQDIELLRLLPNCKHAFHIGCVDLWLERHSSCPLCRHKVSSEDLALITYSDSLRFLQSQSNLREDSNMELFVQREEDNNKDGSSRFSFRHGILTEEELPIQESCDKNEYSEENLHKFNHKIIVSDIILLRNRWSSVSSSDLMFLSSEMIYEESSKRFSSEEVNNEQFSKKVGKTLDRNENRSMSEIIVHPRFQRSITRGETSGSSQNNANDEGQRSAWLPIARSTIQWFANKERRFTKSQNTRQSHV